MAWSAGPGGRGAGDGVRANSWARAAIGVVLTSAKAAAPASKRLFQT
jgi:hypothetical protein